MTPTASRSFAQKTAVGFVSSEVARALAMESSVAAYPAWAVYACALYTVNWMLSDPVRRCQCSIASRTPARRRTDWRMSAGPLRKQIRSCPSARRCSIASAAPARSSIDTDGRPSGASAASKSTTGVPSSTKRVAASCVESAGVRRTPRTAWRPSTSSRSRSSCTEACVEDSVMMYPSRDSTRSMAAAASMKKGFVRSKTATPTSGEVPRRRACAVGLGL